MYNLYYKESKLLTKKCIPVDKDTMEFNNKVKKLFDQLEKTGYETDKTYHHGWITFLDEKRIWTLSKRLKDAENIKALDVIEKIKALAYNPKYQKKIIDDIKNDKYNKHKDTEKQINKNDVKKFLRKKKEEIVKQQFIKKSFNKRVFTNIINSLDREIQEKCMH